VAQINSRTPSPLMTAFGGFIPGRFDSKNGLPPFTTCHVPFNIETTASFERQPSTYNIIARSELFEVFGRPR
jgi:hypothetical protein